jgi:hypothetical protein
MLTQTKFILYQILDIINRIIQRENILICQDRRNFVMYTHSLKHYITMI